MITKYRALRIDNKITLVVQKEHFDNVFNIAKAIHDVVEVKITEDMLKKLMLLLLHNI